MKHTGERQTAPTIEGITADHRKRYEAAGFEIMTRYGRSRIIDAACGVGYGSWIMALQGHDVVGIDIEPEAIAFAKDNYLHPSIDYICADATNDDRGLFGYDYDVAVSFETIEHVENPGELLKLLHSKANLLIASVPNQEVVPYSKTTHPFHVRHYTPAEFDSLLEENGWHPIEFYTQHDKQIGDVLPGHDGRTLIVIAEKKNG